MTVERARKRGSRVWGVVVGGEVREMAEVLRDGGPRKREGGGARSGWRVDVEAEGGERVDIAKKRVSSPAGFTTQWIGILLLRFRRQK